MHRGKFYLGKNPIPCTQTVRLLVGTIVFSIFCLSYQGERQMKIFSTLVLVMLLSVISAAQTSVITYQGKLTEVGAPSNGSFDFTFKLFTTPSEGSPSITVFAEDVPVTAGIFTVNLNFGTLAFTANPPPDYFIEIAVRPGASTSTYTTLSPRQPLTSSPYAIQAIRASSAAVADNAEQLGGVNASEYVQTTDTRMNDARMPLAGSADYIQSNPLSQQPGTNLNIGGNATVGGTLSGNVVNAVTQYNIGGSRVLGVAGANNFFAGVGAGQNNTGTENAFVGSGAGQSNTTGQSNAFFGAAAGQTNTTGNFNAFFGGGTGLANAGGGENSFFGYTAGRFNTSGSLNSFFGKTAGFSNTTGSANSFFGYDAGRLNTGGTNNTFVGVIAGDANTVGSFNTVIGAQADVASNNLNHATAIGAEAVVTTSNTVVLGRTADTVRIPGNLNVAGSFTGNFTVPASNITGVLAAANGGTGLNLPGTSGNFLRSDGTNWTSSVLQASDIASGSTNYIQNIPGIGQQTASFNITGGGTANIFNATTQFNIGGSRVLSAPDAFNTFVGLNAGTANTGNRNSFFGFESGLSNTTGQQNSFFGSAAGRSNTDGGANSFFGEGAGQNNATGFQNSFFGKEAGVDNNAGIQNSFFGTSAGPRNTAGSGNSFTGFEAGLFNTTGGNNSFFGRFAGATNATGANNTMIGSDADVGAGNLSNATAIGAGAIVSLSNSMVLGNNVNVGIGTSFPTYKLEIIDPSNRGLRVQTDTAGGTVASFGGNGAFQIDAPGVTGGRMAVAENGNVGIGTSAPNAKLQIAGGSVYIQQPNSLIITSPNGACWFITVNDAGGLSTISVTCP